MVHEKTSHTLRSFLSELSPDSIPHIVSVQCAHVGIMRSWLTSSDGRCTLCHYGEWINQSDYGRVEVGDVQQFTTYTARFLRVIIDNNTVGLRDEHQWVISSTLQSF